MRVIAVDPGYERCGVAVLERKRGSDTLLYSSCIITRRNSPFAERLVFIGREVSSLIKKHKPTALVIERLYFNTNQKTAMQVAEVRGALIYIAGKHIPIFEYTPPQIKVAVTGWGRADKKQVAQIIPKLLHIKKHIQHDDEYDAIAIGITHLVSYVGHKQVL